MTREFDFYQLEDRVLLSGEGLDCVAGDAVADAALMDALLSEIAADGQVVDDQLAQTEQPLQSTNSANAESPLAGEAITDAALLDQTRPIEVVFIDAGVQDVDTLLNGLSSQDADTQWYLVEISADRDGISQISESLAQLSGVDAIHIVSHGDGSGLQLGNVKLDLDSATSRAGEIASWGAALDTDADLLIYGCDLASTEDGQTLIDSIGALCDCDVAASDDVTGHAELGGDWEFEYVVGVVQTDLAFSVDAQQNWNGTLASVTVTTLDDVVDRTASSIADLNLSLIHI